MKSCARNEIVFLSSDSHLFFNLVYSLRVKKERERKALYCRKKSVNCTFALSMHIERCQENVAADIIAKLILES